MKFKLKVYIYLKGNKYKKNQIISDKKSQNQDS